jgi:hypothetical protein
LDLRLLVDAQHHGIGRRLQVQAHDIGDLRRGVWIHAELEGFEPVGLQRVRAPHAMHRHMRDADLVGQVPRTPVSQARRGWLQGQGDDLGRLARRDGAWSPGSRVIVQTVDAALGEAAPEAAHLHRRVAGLPGDLRTRHILRQQQNRAGTADQPSGGRRHALKPFQCLKVTIRQHDGARLIRHHSLPTER